MNNFEIDSNIESIETAERHDVVIPIVLQREIDDVCIQGDFLLDCHRPLGVATTTNGSVSEGQELHDVDELQTTIPEIFASKEHGEASGIQNNSLDLSKPPVAKLDSNTLAESPQDREKSKTMKRALVSPVSPARNNEKSKSLRQEGLTSDILQGRKKSTPGDIDELPLSDRLVNRKKSKSHNREKTSQQVSSSVASTLRQLSIRLERCDKLLLSYSSQNREKSKSFGDEERPLLERLTDHKSLMSNDSNKNPDRISDRKKKNDSCNGKLLSKSSRNCNNLKSRRRIVSDSSEDSEKSMSCERSGSQKKCPESQNRTKHVECVQTPIESLKSRENSKTCKHDKISTKDSKDCEKFDPKKPRDCVKSESHKRDIKPTESLKDHEKSKSREHDKNLTKSSKDFKKFNPKKSKNHVKPESHSLDIKPTKNSKDLEKSKPREFDEIPTENSKDPEKSGLKKSKNSLQTESHERDKKTTDNSKYREKSKARVCDETTTESSKDPEKSDLKKSKNCSKSESHKRDKETTDNSKDIEKSKSSERDKPLPENSTDREKSPIENSRDHKKSTSERDKVPVESSSKPTESKKRKASTFREHSRSPFKSRERDISKRKQRAGGTKSRRDRSSKRDRTWSKSHSWSRSKSHSRSRTRSRSKLRSKSHNGSLAANGVCSEDSSSTDSDECSRMTPCSCSSSTSSDNSCIQMSTCTGIGTETSPTLIFNFDELMEFRLQCNWTPDRCQEQLNKEDYVLPTPPVFKHTEESVINYKELRLEIVPMEDQVLVDGSPGYGPQEDDDNYDFVEENDKEGGWTDCEYNSDDPDQVPEPEDREALFRNQPYSSEFYVYSSPPPDFPVPQQLQNMPHFPSQNNRPPKSIPSPPNSAPFPSSSAPSPPSSAPSPSSSAPSPSSSAPSPSSSAPSPSSSAPSPSSSAPSPEPSPPHWAPSASNSRTNPNNLPPDENSNKEIAEKHLVTSMDTDSDTDLEIVNIFKSSSRTRSKYTESNSTKNKNYHSQKLNHGLNISIYNSYLPKTTSKLPETVTKLPETRGMDSYLDFFINNPNKLYPHSTLPKCQTKPLETNSNDNYLKHHSTFPIPKATLSNSETKPVEEHLDLEINPYSSFMMINPNISNPNLKLLKCQTKPLETKSNDNYLKHHSTFPIPKATLSNSETKPVEEHLDLEINPYSSFMMINPNISNPNLKLLKCQTKPLEINSNDNYLKHHLTFPIPKATLSNSETKPVEEHLDLKINPYSSFMMNNPNISNPNSKLLEVNQMTPDFNPQSSFAVYNPNSFDLPIPHTLHSTPLSKHPISLTEHFKATSSPIAQQTSQWLQPKKNPCIPSAQSSDAVSPLRSLTFRPLEPPPFFSELFLPYEQTLDTTSKINPSPDASRNVDSDVQVFGRVQVTYSPSKQESAKKMQFSVDKL